MGCGAAKPPPRRSHDGDRTPGDEYGAGEFITVLPPEGGARGGRGGRTQCNSLLRLETAHKRRASIQLCAPDGIFAEDHGVRGETSPTSEWASRSRNLSAQRSVLGMSRLMSGFQKELLGYMGARDGEKNGLLTAPPGLSQQDDAENLTSEERLTRLFNTLDTKRTGRISLPQLQHGWQKAGWAHSAKALEQMFRLSAVAPGDASPQQGSPREREWIDRASFNKFFRGLASVDDLRHWDPDNDDWLQTRVVRRPPRGREYAWGARPVRSYDLVIHVGHPTRVKSIAVDPCRSYYVSCHCDHPKVDCRELDGVGETLRSFHGHRDTVMVVAMSPDLKVMATGSRDATLILWELVTGHMLHTMRHAGVVTSLAFSFDGRFIITGGADAVLRRYRTDRGKLKARSEELGLGVVVTVAYGDGVVAASLSGQHSLHLLVEKTLQPQKVLYGHSSSVWSLHFNQRRDQERRERAQRSLARLPRRDDEAAEDCAPRLLSACKEFLRVWDVSSFVPLRSFTPAHGSLDPVPTQPAPQPMMAEGKDAVSPRHLSPTRHPHAPGGAAAPAGPRWICATWLGGDFGHVIAASRSDHMLCFFSDAAEPACVLQVATRASVYTVASAHEQNELLCGDEIGNVYRVTLR